MEFPFAKPKAAKINLATKTITLSFDVPLNVDSQMAAEALAVYVGKDDARVELRVIPNQLPLPGVSVLNRPDEPVRKVDPTTGEILDEKPLEQQS
jgi:hypothetical protein